jgi:hypothetical protein
MNPHIIKLLIKGHEEKIKEQDYLAWLFNQYTLSAVTVAVEHNLAGKKAKSKYIEKPFLQQVEENNKPITQEEIKRQRLLFISKMNNMKANFELNNKFCNDK